MLNEKDLKLTINKLYSEMKNINILKEPNTINFIYSRTIQIIALMKILNKEEIFSKQEIQSYDLFKKINQQQYYQDKIKEAYEKYPLGIPPIQSKQQLTLSDIPNEELQLFVKEFNERKKGKIKKKTIINNNIPELELKERK